MTYLFKRHRRLLWGDEMSRCKACNKLLTEEDLVRRYPPDEHGKREFADLCFDCYDVSLAVLYDNYEDSDEHLYIPHSMSRMQEDWA